MNLLKNLKFLQLFVFAIFIFCTHNILGQSITWEKTYLPSFATTGRSVKQTSDGNYIITGVRTGIGGFICKLNSYGDTIWVKHTPYEQMHSIVESTDGNYVAIGYNTYLYITKFSPTGNQIWANEIEEPGHDIFAFNIINTNDNCFLVCGNTRFGTPSSIKSAYYIKIDNNGNKIWSKFISPPNETIAFLNSYQTTDNGFVMTGWLNTNNSKIFLAKSYPNGDTQWTKTYSSAAFTYGCSVFQTSDKGYIIFGNNEYSNQNIKLYFLKTDSLGNFQWSKIYGDTNSYYQLLYGENAIKSKFDNSYFITGFKTNYPSLDTNKIFLLNVDENGNRLWEKNYKKDTLDLRGFAIDQTSDSGFVISGDAFYYPFSDNSLSDPQLLYVLKLNKYGLIDPIGINPIKENILQKFYFKSIYPNPFNPETNIEFVLPKATYLTIIIYNILGEEVQKLTEGLFNYGTHKLKFDMKSLNSGIYFVKIISRDGWEEVKKAVYIK